MRWLDSLLQFWHNRGVPPRPANKDELGIAGEAIAARQLCRKRMKIVGRRERTSLGEIDLVALDKGTIVFVEVKTRFGSTLDDALNAVDQRKQARLTKLALAYLRKNGLLEHPARFDVVAVSWPEKGPPLVRHVENAFESVGDWQMFS